MEDLDKTLDIMERDKSVSLLQENSVRVKKNNIKFTKLNKKNSQEHLDLQLVSYERLVRNLIRQLLTMEKKIRLKYLTPMDDERELKLMRVWNTEVECALEDLNIKFRDIHVQRRSVEDFDAKVSAMRTKAKSEIESQVPELREKLLAEIGSSERIDPGWNEKFIHKIPKVVSGLTENCLEIIINLYSKAFIKIVKSSVFCSENNKIISDNYKITKDQKIGIIPPIGGG